MGFKQIKSQLSKFNVGIAGAGGLGSNCAVSLARSGIGTLVICDYDRIDFSNLNRQYYFSYQQGELKVEALKEVIKNTGSDTKVITHCVRLTPENIPVIFNNCRLVVEALDEASEKEMLIQTIQSKMKSTILVVASGVAGWGCIDRISVRKIDETLYMCGDGSTEVSYDMPALAPKVGAVANLQAALVIDLLMNS